MHILLLFSIILTVISSYFLTLLCENKKVYTAVCCFSAILFAQIVFICQILSLFSAVEPVNIVGFNILFFVISSVLFVRKQINPDFKEDFISEYEKIRYAFRSDRWLKYTAVVFAVFLAGTMIYIFLIPANDADAFSYHIARLPFWYSAKNVAHFECADIRTLIMPINSEIFYFWAYSFIKSTVFVRFFSLFSYILFVVGLRGLLREISIPVKISLWVIFAVTAMQNVLFSISDTETNISVAALMLSAVYMFVAAVKNNNKKVYLFVSALLFALAAGVKTPALMAAPALLLTASSVAFVYQKKNFYKPLLLCLVFLLINFILFASYNYFLNYIDFGNPLTSSHAAECHGFYGGFKGFTANIVKYLASFIDFSGFLFSFRFWLMRTAVVSQLLGLMNIPFDTGTIISENEFLNIGNNIENMCGLGVLGFLVFLPSVFFALKYFRHSKRSVILWSFAVGFVINLIVLSLSLGYMVYSIRFIMIFVMFASPVIAYFFLKYRRLRKFISILMIYTFLSSSLMYEKRSLPNVLSVFVQNPSFSEFKQKIECANNDFYTESDSCTVTKMLKQNKPVNVLFFISQGRNIYYLKKAEDENFKTDFRRIETFDESDLDKYDYIVTPKVQENTNVAGREKPDFSEESFAKCEYKNYKNGNFDRVTTSLCSYNEDILQKHNFRLLKKIYSYDKDLYIYKKSEE